MDNVDSHDKRFGAPSHELPAHLKEFDRLLAMHGYYVLGCGGGVLLEPRCAIDRLRSKYTESDLLDLCLEACLLPDPLPSQLQIGIVHGILFHLGNEETLEKLIAHYPNSADAEHKVAFNGPNSNYYGLGFLQSLISGLSKKLGHLPPEGFDHFSDFDCHYVFCPDNYPEN